MTSAPSFEQLLAQVSEQLKTLPDKPEETPEATLRALWHTAAGLPKSPDLAQSAPLPQLAAEQYEALRQLIARRLAGIPLAHLTQRQSFLGLEMLTGPGALIPRKETELLARTAIRLLQEKVDAEPCVIDVCTGSGNVAIAIASRVPRAHVYAADLSTDAVELARSNARHLGMHERVDFRSGDLLTPFDSANFRGSVDLVTCNPPYIASANVERMANEIAEHEPRLAFDGGPFGISILMRLMREAPRYLRPSGWLAFEVGLDQGPALLRLLSKRADFLRTEGISDAQGAVRVITAQRR